MLKVSNLTIELGDRTLLDDVSFTLHGGDRVALFGSSGSGKTTLLHTLAGLRKPNKGSILCSFGEEILAGETTDQVTWPTLTLVFQDIRLFRSLDGRSNCLVGMSSDPANQSYIQDLAKTMGVLHCLEKTPEKMSQGERQRIALIRALVRKPKYLLLDEPTSALDPRAQNHLRDVLYNLGNDVAVLCATHDLAFAKAFANSFYVLSETRLDQTPNIEIAFSTLTKMPV